MRLAAEESLVGSCGEALRVPRGSKSKSRRAPVIMLLFIAPLWPPFAEAGASSHEMKSFTVIRVSTMCGVVQYNMMRWL